MSHLWSRIRCVKTFGDGWTWAAGMAPYLLISVVEQWHECHSYVTCTCSTWEAEGAIDLWRRIWIRPMK